MIEIKKRSVACLLCAAMLVFSAAGCSRRSRVDDIEEPEQSGFVFINTLEEPDYAVFARVGPKLTPQVKEKYELNDDTVGWIYIPNSELNDVVVQNNDPDDRNQFYERRNFEKRSSWTGVFYADYRCLFGDSWRDLSRNTVLYGHSMEDDPDGPLFSQTKKYWDEDFAIDNPYIYFSTYDEDLTWEVFAVFFATTGLNYNYPNYTEEEFLEMMEEVRSRSFYNYDVEVSADDKILTLSTCTYQFTSVYPNNDRFVIMARLVQDHEPLKETASLEVNPSPAPR